MSAHAKAIKATLPLLCSEESPSANQGDYRRSKWWQDWQAQFREDENARSPFSIAGVQGTFRRSARHGWWIVFEADQSVNSLALQSLIKTLNKLNLESCSQ